MASIFNVFNKPKKERVYWDLNDPELMGKMRGGDNEVDYTSDSTYFTCIKIMSETLGKLPFQIYKEDGGLIEEVTDHPIFSVLRFRPNPYTTPSIFWSTVEANRLHHGNAYVYIERNRQQQVENLWLMPSEHVVIRLDNRGFFGRQNAIYYEFNDPHSGEKYYYHADDVMHFKTSHTFDGITGTSMRDKLSNLVKGASASQRYLTELYQSGLTAKTVLQYTGDMDDKMLKRMEEQILKRATGTAGVGNVISIPLGMTLTPLNLTLADSQFAEMRRLNSLEIAAAFGVKPYQLNSYDVGNNNNAEMQNLFFYTDTLLFELKHYEEEIGYKLFLNSEIQAGYSVQLDVDSILRADGKTMMETIAIGVNNFLLTPNEARARLKKPALPDGDKLIGNGNYMPSNMIGAQWNQNTNDGGEEQ